MTACPALAYSRDAETGAVLLDQGKCIGCRYCSWACPYDAPRFDPDERLMTKCTFCVERLRNGSLPACADLCPTGALGFDHLAEEEIVNEAEGFPRSSLKPAIKIVAWSGGSPADVSGATDYPVSLASQPVAARVSLQSEWSLLAFTFIVASLFGALAAQVAGGVGVNAVAFVGTAVLGIALSGLHLGRKTRAWRIVLNVAQSWLSRETVSVGLFVACGTVYLVVTPAQQIIGWTAVASGLVALFSIDMVYQFGVRIGPRVPHSANLVFTGPLLAGVLLLDPAIGVLFGVSKLVLYVLRKVIRGRVGLPWRLWVTSLRIGVGFVAPGLLWAANAEGFAALVIACVLVGEFADRAEFYEELELDSPQRQMRLDLVRRLAVSPAGDTRSSIPHERS
jgi:ferredoxin